MNRSAAATGHGEPWTSAGTERVASHKRRPWQRGARMPGQPPPRGGIDRETKGLGTPSDQGQRGAPGPSRGGGEPLAPTSDRRIRQHEREYPPFSVAISGVNVSSRAKTRRQSLHRTLAGNESASQSVCAVAAVSLAERRRARKHLDHAPERIRPSVAGNARPAASLEPRAIPHAQRRSDAARMARVISGSAPTHRDADDAERQFDKAVGE